MSRIGRLPVPISKGVDVKQANGTVTVKGPKGQLDLTVHPDMIVVIDASEVRVERPSDHKDHRALHGLTRSLIANMVQGVTEGFERKLELVGVGYRAQAQGNKLNLTLGFSHPVVYDVPEGVSVETPSQTEVVIKGSDKQKVGQVAAEIRRFRPPEPYKGKGVRYSDERVQLKEAKKK